MKVSSKQQIQGGFGIVEVIIAISIFIIITITQVSTVVQSFSVNRLGGELTEATLIAQEGVEAVRSIRNQDWVDMVPGVYGVDNSSGNWQFFGTSDTIGKFTREINLFEVQRVNNFCDLTIVPSGGVVDPNTVKVSSRVTWDFTSGRNNTFEFVTYLSNRIPPNGSWGNPSVGSGQNLPGKRNGRKISIQDDYAYIVRDGGNPDFVIINISDPCSLFNEGSLNLSDRPENIAVSGSYAYVASRSNSEELQIIDISDVQNPSVVGTVDTPGDDNAMGVYVDGSYAYLVTKKDKDDDEFFVIDISAPTSPGIVGSEELGNEAREVAVEGNYAYTTSKKNSQELLVINITTKSTPSLVASLDLVGKADPRSIAVYNSVVYLGRKKENAGNLHTIDVSTPTSPSELDSISTGEDINDVGLNDDGTIIFVVQNGGNQEFQAYDASDTSNLSLSGSLDMSNDLNGVAYHSSQDLIYAVGDADNSELFVIEP